MNYVNKKLKLKRMDFFFQEETHLFYMDFSYILFSIQDYLASYLGY